MKKTNLKEQQFTSLYQDSSVHEICEDLISKTYSVKTVTTFITIKNFNDVDRILDILRIYYNTEAAVLMESECDCLETHVLEGLYFSETNTFLVPMARKDLFRVVRSMIDSSHLEAVHVTTAEQLIALFDGV